MCTVSEASECPGIKYEHHIGKYLKRIFIIYYPATKEPDVEDMYHEYYVPLMSLQTVFGQIQYVGINVQHDSRKPKVRKDDLVVIWPGKSDITAGCSVDGDCDKGQRCEGGVCVADTGMTKPDDEISRMQELANIIK